MLIRPYHVSDEADVLALWEDCGLIVPQNDPRLDIARKLKVNPELFLVGTLDGAVVATCMAGYEGHRGWINYLAVAPNQQGQGRATELVAEAAKLLKEIGCPKINLQIRKGNVGVAEFYRKIGFVEDPVMSLGLRLISDETSD